MSSELVSINDIERMASAIAKSGLFGMQNADQAFALMCVAQAEGLHPAIAARDYHLIKGRASLKADAMLARFQTAGGSVKWGEYTDKKVSGTFSHPQGGSILIEWTVEMAKNAGLAGNDNWKKYPRAMMRARCISEGIRATFPGVVAGYYTPEEVEDMPAKEEMRDVTPTPAASTPKTEKKKGRLDAIVDSQPEILEGEIVTDAPAYTIDDDLTAMRECETLEALQSVFGSAWKACPEESRDVLKGEYDTLKAKFATPAPAEDSEEAPI